MVTATTSLPFPTVPHSSETFSLLGAVVLVLFLETEKERRAQSRNSAAFSCVEVHLFPGWFVGTGVRFQLFLERVNIIELPLLW